MEDVFISVIINSYKRKDYIRDAVFSVLNQHLDKDKYELIVVKGFIDHEIDMYLKNNGVKSLYLEGSYNGKRWIEGAIKSKGNVICFLDDDDQFSTIKLKRVYEIYKDTNFDYYHNFYSFDITALSEKFKKYYVLKNAQSSRSIRDLLKYNIRYKLNINSSSICVKKDILLKFVNQSMEVTIGWDVFIFYLYLSYGTTFVADETHLTYYRQHRSYTHQFINEIEFKESEIIRNNDAKNAYILYKEIVSQPFLKKTLEYESFSYLIAGYICHGYGYTSPNMIKLILFFLYSNSYSIKFRIAYFILGVLSKLSRTFAFKVYFRLNKIVTVL